MTNHSIELPLVEPLYSTYHNQGISSAVIHDNLSIENWFLNEIMQLSCNTDFLKGFTTPNLVVIDANYESNPHLEQIRIPFKHLAYYSNRIIKSFLRDRYFVVFYGLDDYYLPGKTWYREEHFPHDGLISGYDDIEKTYTLFAYDYSWIYRTFKVHFSDFDKSKRSMVSEGTDGYICAVRPFPFQPEFDPDVAKSNIQKYLACSIDEHGPNNSNHVFGIIVHDYLKKYLDRLSDGSISIKSMDWRIFRLIWEHKKVMLRRLDAIKNDLHVSDTVCQQYFQAVKLSDDARMMYARYRIRPKNELADMLKSKLDEITEIEKRTLTIMAER